MSMYRYHLVASFDKDLHALTSEIIQENSLVVVHIPFMTSSGALRYGLQTTIDELSKQAIYPSEAGFDAIIFGVLVYMADMRISRRIQAQDSWSREIILTIPVYDMRWEAWSMDGARYSLRYHIYALKLDLDSIAETCFDLGKIVIKQIYKKSMKKFIRKFSDYVWGFSVKKEDDKSWSEKVDEAMEMAYQAAKHKFNKECGNIIKRGVCDILGGVIVNKVIEEIIKIVEPIIKTLSDALPDNIKDMLDLEEMAKNDIQEVLTGTFEGAVYDQDGPFTEELNKAIENCQI